MRRYLENYDLAEILRLVRTTRHGWLFLTALGCKIALVCLYTPQIYQEFWLPFVRNWIASGLTNPWDAFLAAGGSPKAFPYGTGMLLILAPLLSIKLLLFGPAAAPSTTEAALLGLPVLGMDLLVLLLLIYAFNLRSLKAVYIYWCSPVVLYVCYIHGQLDLIPMGILLAAVVALSRSRYAMAGVLLGLGIATKESLLVAVPFAFFFALKRSGVVSIFRLILPAGLSWLALFLPAMGSSGFRTMVSRAEEKAWIFNSSLTLHESEILLVPLAMGALFLSFAMLRKVNTDMLVMYTGLAFTILLLLVPANAPGWYLWVVPFYCYYSLMSYHIRPWAITLFSILFVLYFCVSPPAEFLHFSQAPGIPLAALLRELSLSSEQISRLTGTLFTLMQGSIAWIAWIMYRQGVQSNDLYRMRDFPLVIGIGGDSGAGKDTLCLSIRSLLGNRNIIQADGDDHHKWERGDKNWQEYTHLNPKANNLHHQFKQASDLRKGSMVVRRFYQHGHGKFSGPRIVESSPYVLVSGLHPFYIKSMRELIDIKIFMDTEEELRRDWKIQRDMEERGYTREQVLAKMNDRRDDGLRYIAPQKEYADMIIRQHYVHSAQASQRTGTGGEPPGPENGLPPTAIEFVTDNSINLEVFCHEFAGTNGVTVSHEYIDGDRQILRLNGRLTARQIHDAAWRIIPNLDELITPGATFEEDYRGLTQLVFLSMLSYKEMIVARR